MYGNYWMILHCFIFAAVTVLGKFKIVVTAEIVIILRFCLKGISLDPIQSMLLIMVVMFGMNVLCVTVILRDITIAVQNDSLTKYYIINLSPKNQIQHIVRKSLMMFEQHFKNHSSEYRTITVCCNIIFYFLLISQFLLS